MRGPATLINRQCASLQASTSRAPAPRQSMRIRAALATEAPPASKSNGNGSHQGPIIVNGQVLHSITKERLELIGSMDNYVEQEIVPLLKPVDKCWQPQDFLPAPESPEFLDAVAELRKRTEALPDEYLVVLVGDMITEEALPTYMHMLNTLDGVADETGASQTPWARWTREWTAEENRHGDLMNKYCWLTGRVNMRSVEVTIQKLIGSGMDPKTENNPYLGFVYTSFQERATKISHGHTAFQATQYGDELLGKLCGAIASDESRHEMAYTKIVDELFRLDPSGATLAFADMMRKQIVMPAHLMDDLEHGKKNPGRNLFADFSAVAERTGTYTASDYASIMEHLITRWKVADMTGLTPEAAAAQDYVCNLPPRIRKLAERAATRKAKVAPVDVTFSWIFDRPLSV